MQQQYAHWHQFFENIPVSPRDFYKALEERINLHKLPGLTLTQVEFPEGGPLSAKRLYLELQRDWMKYHICAAPFGTGFFVSSRLLVWPWRSWPIVVLLGSLLFGALGLFALLAAAALHGLVFAVFIFGLGFFPCALCFALIVVVWAILCIRLTYYRLDTMLAFQEAVHRILVAEVNTHVEASGRKSLSDEESKPILHRLLGRRPS